MTEETWQAYKFAIDGVADPENYAPGYPYIVEYGRTEAEARELAAEHLEPSETVGAVIA
jgi:hypothetical protein